jgi:uncharacterized membrane protein
MASIYLRTGLLQISLMSYLAIGSWLYRKLIFEKNIELIDAAEWTMDSGISS